MLNEKKRGENGSNFGFVGIFIAQKLLLLAQSEYRMRVTIVMCKFDGKERCPKKKEKRSEKKVKPKMTENTELCDQQQQRDSVQKTKLFHWHNDSNSGNFFVVVSEVQRENKNKISTKRKARKRAAAAPKRKRRNNTKEKEDLHT